MKFPSMYRKPKLMCECIKFLRLLTCSHLFDVCILILFFIATVLVCNSVLKGLRMFLLETIFSASTRMHKWEFSLKQKLQFFETLNWIFPDDGNNIFFAH